MTQGDRKRNKEWVDQALEEDLVPGLKFFIQRQMKQAYGKNWLQDARLGLQDYHLEGDDLKWRDPQVVLKLIIDHWNNAFRDAAKFGHFERSLVSELLQVRNEVKHNQIEKFDDDYTFRALDSMARLLAATDDKSAKKAAQTIEQQKAKVRQGQATVEVEDKPESGVTNQSTPVTQKPEVRHSFQSLIEEKTAGFIGREFVFQAIEEFLTSQPSGYFIIQGEPGIGKSAILAKYVQQTGCVAHFNVRSQGINRADQFLENVCTQLIARYNLPYSSLPPDAKRDGKVFSQLLAEIVKAQGVAPKKGKRLVIAVDALDEVDQTDHSGANLLYLPTSLDKGVYLVMTQRPVTLTLTVNTPPHRFNLMQYQTQSLEDIHRYIRSEINKSSPLQAWIDERGLTVGEFVTQLANKSENNFMYLRYVLPDIADGKYRNLSIESLPQGLQDYYEDHWRRMGMFDKESKRTKIKIVYVLAELREPVSRELIAEFAGEDAFTVQEVLDEWQQFLHRDKFNGETRYSIYHSSFCDFLSRKDIVQAAGVTLQDINARISDKLMQGMFGDE
ncbi:Swt1 family HEPN domain-containing protein [Coleofasciculus sp. E2-BRE-01]|uniref:Swt1 family HEPN domain-containing protein n=1 Tax=Coleofasciculus sp. E2-BRE-01 TaxID=3069524 RepID=UPI0032F92C5B